MRRALVRLALTCVVGLAVADRLPAELLATGNEFQVSTYTLNQAKYPSVALDEDFDFVVTWESYGRDGHSWGVFARRYDSEGAPIGADFQVNTYTSGPQLNAAVTLAANGSFVIAWTSDLGQDGANAGIFARRFNSAGTPQASEFLVNIYTIGNQGGISNPPGNSGPAIAAEPNGDFVVTWTDGNQDGANGGIFGRRFDAAGTPLTADFQINVYTTGIQQYPSVAVDGDGDFVVTWQSYFQDGGQNGVFARRFASSGGAVAGEFQVNSRTLLNQKYPAVGLETNGDFVVTWQSFGHDGGYPLSDAIVARRFASTGIGIGAEFLVNTYTSSAQRYPSIGVDGDGEFVITWQTSGVDGELDGVFGRRYDNEGLPLGPDFLVNSFTTSFQNYPAVGMNAVGDFVVAWQSYGQDGSSTGVFAQRYDNVAILDVDGNGAIGPLTDGILILRFMFGFTGPTLVSGAVDLEGCQRCDEPTILTYLNTLI